MLLVFGYFYGILRANLLTAFSHFIFDAGLMGLYASAKWSAPRGDKRSNQARVWTILLCLWPTLLIALPFQPLLISLVGWRGNVFFIPLLYLGTRLKGKDLIELSLGFAALNLVALAFAVAEYFLGLPRFFPFSPVTEIMYHSHDVQGGFYRIPSIFSSAAAYGGTMVGSIPFLAGIWTGAQNRLHRLSGLLGLPAAFIGILMSATRTNFVLGCVMAAFMFFRIKMKGSQRALFLIVIGLVGFAAVSNARFGRFKSLDDANYVQERIAGSVNRGFFEILVEYPMGNGLGGGGTSMPYFLQGSVRNPIGMENEYARILAEQGIIGFLLWVGLIVWFLSRSRVAFAKGPWSTARKMAWCLVALGFADACIGTGFLTSIPATLITMIGAGWTTTAPEVVRKASGADPRSLSLQTKYSRPAHAITS